MSDKRLFVLTHHEARRRSIMSAVADAPDGYLVTVEPPKRSLDQNSMLWPILARFSAQLLWPVNGAMTKLEPEDWKHILTAAFRRESARVAAGLDGGMVMLGARTSTMSKREFSEFLEFVLATAADRGVELDEATA